MHFCYVDESGGSEPSDAGTHATPVMVIAGMIVNASLIPALTRDFLSFKRHYFPNRFTAGPALDHVLAEVKGGEILQMTRSDSRNKRRQARLIRAGLLELVRSYDCQVVGRVWVKRPGIGLKPDATYCYAMQDIATHFNHYLGGHDSQGVIIADGRTHSLNVNVGHSVFTQKWRTGDDPYPSVMEAPLFAHSDNHVGLQLADLVVSTLVFPMAASAYGAPSCSVHASGRYRDLRADHGAALRGLQYRYRDEAMRWRGGLVVSDPGRRRSGSLLFKGCLYPGPDRWLRCHSRPGSRPSD